MLSLDTDERAQQVQLDAYRRMGPGRCAELCLELSEDSREIARAGIRHRHPGYDDGLVEWALRRILFGDALFGEVWPDAPLVDP